MYLRNYSRDTNSVGFWMPVPIMRNRAVMVKPAPVFSIILVKTACLFEPPLHVWSLNPYESTEYDGLSEASPL